MKKIIIYFEDIYWSIKCRFNFFLHGSYGLTRTIEKIPFRFVLKYMRKYGATIGAGVIIDSGFKLHRPDSITPLKNLIIGNNVYIGHNILLDLTDKIIFEDNSAMGANCQIWTHVGDYVHELRNKSDYFEKVGRVVISSGAVCYSNVIINPDVIVGKNSRVFALSLVSSIIPESQIWAGIPAKFKFNRNLEKQI